MGYFLTNIGYKRDRKLSVAREKFEKLYHPFYLMITELGSDTEDGNIALGSEEDVCFSSLKPFIDHLMKNVYLASPEGQTLFSKTRLLHIECMAAGDSINEEKARQFEESFGALCNYLLLEYLKTAKVLGYDLDTDDFSSSS
jgi:hypothetical protein